MEYMDESFIRNTSRELITALQVSPDELNAAADALLKQEIQVKIQNIKSSCDPNSLNILFKVQMRKL